LSACLDEIRSEDLAEIIDLFEPAERDRVLSALDHQVAGEVLSQVDEAVRSALVEEMPAERMEAVFATLPPDDAADFIAELPKEQSEDLLKQISPEQADEIRPLLEYDEETAGGVMTPDVLSVNIDASVQDAIDQLRQAQLDPQHADTFFNVFVTDAEDRLQGFVSIPRLITAPPMTAIADLMDREFASAHVDEDQEHVLNTLRRYDLVTIPVVDDLGKLVGRITHDDLMDVAAEEAAEDLYRMAGTDAAELESASIVRAARIRATWLIPCLLGTAVSSLILISFEAHSLVVLIPFVPMIPAMGGNSGIQTSTVIVSRLATGDFAISHLLPVFFREIRIALVLAMICALAAGCIVPVTFSLFEGHGDPLPAATLIRTQCAVGLSMFLAILTAVTLGTFFPFAFRRLGVDPAIASGPFITTLNDITGLTIYMTVGLLILN